MGVYLSEPQTSKKIALGQKKSISFCCAQMQGWRKTMQDAAIHQLQNQSLKGYHIFGVFDGHGGFEVSKYVQKVFVQVLASLPQFKQGNYGKALQQAFRKVDQLIDSQQGKKQLQKIRNPNQTAKGGMMDDIGNSTGCTANVLLITKDKYYIANAGDSRSALCTNGKAVQLSYDHKPQSQIESKRIKQAGGTISMGRVNGGLNLSRSLGDFDYKRNKQKQYYQQMITCHPDIKVFDRNPYDQFIIMGCDGIWQQYTQNCNQMIQSLKKQIDSNAKSNTKIVEELLDRLLAKNTSQSGGLGCDNMTAILIRFK